MSDIPTAAEPRFSPRRLRASWNLDPDQNPPELHAAEQEIFQAMSEEISRDLNRAILSAALEIAADRWRKRELKLLGRIRARGVKLNLTFWAVVERAEDLLQRAADGDKVAEDVFFDLLREHGLPAAYGEARWKATRLREIGKATRLREMAG